MPDLTRAQVLVTGGAGFIGSSLVDELISRGASVTVIDNLANGKKENLAQHFKSSRFRFVEGSILDNYALDDAFDGVTSVLHLATLGVRHSIKFPFETHLVNAEGTLKTLMKARETGVERFVYCSSSEIYGTAEYVPMPETHPPYPCTIYGASKLAGEAYARAFFKTYEMPTVVVRPFNTFGPRSHHEGDAGELIPKSIVRALNGEPILVFGDGLQTRDFTFVKDTARGLTVALTDDNLIGGTYNIGSNFEISIKSVAERIRDAIGGARIEFVKSRPGDVLRLYADPSKFINATGWKPQISFEEGIAQTIEWFKSRPEGTKALLNGETGFNWE